MEAVDRGRFEPILVGVRRDGGLRTGPVDMPLAQIVEAGAEVTDLRALAPDVAFPVLHGPFGEDGTFQGMFEVLGIPYVGSGVLASAACMDKGVFKQLARAAEVPVVDAVEIRGWHWADADRRAAMVKEIGDWLGFPCFVKPANQGSSVGVSKAEEGSLSAAVETALRYDDKVLVERAVNCREVELAVLGDGGPETLVSVPGEIALPQGVWYSYETKYEQDVATYHLPAELPAETVAKLQAWSLDAFRVAGCHGLARIDFLVDRVTGEAYLNEVNTMPGFTSISMYPKLMGHGGVAYGDLITRLCDLALERQSRRDRLDVTR